ncbi:glycosyltransferase [uncultured Leifsonia sp.]|uniref:glycosyltransferase n=1 Tax=uncultured Leifsonia sp. TaxID=340359 RepID=UPI0028D272A3|nr:glycosyltransferase [uncultured Leifsonia sp.]
MPIGRQPSVLVAHPGAELYGSDRVMLETVGALVDAGYRVTVAVPGDGPLLVEVRRRGASAEIIAAPVLRRRLLSPGGLASLAVQLPAAVARAIATIRRNDIDVVYASTLTIPTWLLAARLARRTAVCHVHEAESSAGRLVKRALSTPLLLADAIAANSEFCAGVLAEPYPRLAGRTSVVLNPVDGPAAVTPPREELDGRIRLVYVGRLSERKGVGVAVDAVTILRDRGRPVSLDLVGDVFAGNEGFRAELQEKIQRAALGDAVRLLGFRPSVWDELSAADIALVPSLADETFGNAAVEAILAERPVIASDTSGLREAAAGYDTAELVRPGDAVALADAAERIADDWPSYRAGAPGARAAAERRHARKRYDADILRVITGA